MNVPGSNFLYRIAADSISERLAVVNREFDTALALFSNGELMSEALKNLIPVRSVSRIDFPCSFAASVMDDDKTLGTSPEAIPFEQGSISLITSLFGLHWSNDLPGSLIQILRALKPDGLFMATMPGTGTLRELRESLMEAESQLTGGASLRVDPFGEVRQLGNLLQRAGFALPVVDTEAHTARYSGVQTLVRDLRAMSASNVQSRPAKPISHEIFKLTEEIYRSKFGDSDGKIRATFEIVYLSGWAPHESQQKPLRPGDAEHKLSDFL